MILLLMSFRIMPDTCFLLVNKSKLYTMYNNTIYIYIFVSTTESNEGPTRRSKREALLIRRGRKKSLEQSATDTFRFFNAVKG
jgi:hypothetical protein